MQLFANHNIENHCICLLHTHRAYPAKVCYGLLDILVDNAVGRRDTYPLHSQHRRLDRAGHARGYFHRTAFLSPVTHHSGDITYHILDGIAYLLETSAAKHHDAAAGSGRCHHAAAESREFAKIGLDVDGNEVAECQSPDEAFLV